ncbi:MAG: DUF1722 domain-containing protein [Candidatus Methylomirabilota bacterium]|nr:MAG: DUF1722 domain-containing protein [candidate division NC10 bacterium]
MNGAIGPIRIGISSCLLGDKVRYDGGHKHDRFLTDTLGRLVEWVPVCPEVEVGMGTPREPIQLVRRHGDIRLVGIRTETDHTDVMQGYARRRVEQLADSGLSGFILKQDSPSCGLDRVRVHRDRGPATRTGRGLFASTLTQRFPNLPIEEEGRLHNPRLREHWIERVCAYHRLQSLWTTRWRIDDLARFHAAHRFALLAHAPPSYQRLRRLIARATALSQAVLRERYERGFMAAFTVSATRSRHVTVLRLLLGRVSDGLDEPAYRELLDRIHGYRRGLAPLIVPVSLIAHYVRIFDIDDLKGQEYLDPHPVELVLRHHV